GSTDREFRPHGPGQGAPALLDHHTCRSCAASRLPDVHPTAHLSRNLHGRREQTASGTVGLLRVLDVWQVPVPLAHSEASPDFIALHADSPPGRFRSQPSFSSRTFFFETWQRSDFRHAFLPTAFRRNAVEASATKGTRCAPFAAARVGAAIWARIPDVPPREKAPVYGAC